MAMTSDVQWHQADLLDGTQVTSLLAGLRPTHLLHSAWYAVPGQYWTSLENFRWVEASLHLLRSFAAAGGQRVVGVGSCAEYDWRNGHCSEQITPLDPATTYGVCKHALQLLLAALAKQTGLSAAWARMFFLYGPHEAPERLVASVIRSLLQNEPAYCSQGEQIRDFLYVQDAADALVTLLDSDVQACINIGSGLPLSVRQIVQEIGKQLQLEKLIQLGARPASPNEPPLLLADVTRLRDELGWLPRHDLSSGIQQTINWWKIQLQE